MRREAEDEDEEEKEFRRLTSRSSRHSLNKKHRRRKHPDLLVKVPVWWLEKVATLDTTSTSKTLLVGIWLFYLSLKNNRRLTFSVSNAGAKEFGISPRAKRKALRQLEAARLILVDRRPRKNPIVTLVVV
jgi:hypothetical protein